MKIRLVDDWRKVHSYGVAKVAYVMTGVGALGPWISQAWNFIPQDLRDALPRNVKQAMAYVLFAIFLLFVRHVTMAPKPPEGDSNG